MSEDETKESPPAPPAPPVIREHTMRHGDTTIGYTSTTGMMVLANEKDEPQAHIFYTAYSATTISDPLRPLIFVFNGGPGSGSVWLHLGAFGPKRVRLNDDGTIPPPPYQLLENTFSLLPHADLVFIDPVGTGFSRPVNEEAGKKAWSVDGDFASVGQFIRLYLTRNSRMTAPIYLLGESYGTFRAAGLANHLLDKHIAVSGVILIAPILNFQSAMVVKGNDLAFALILPTYTAGAYYQKRLPTKYQEQPLHKLLAEVEEWALDDYIQALIRGDRLQGNARQKIVTQLARYTGLSERYVANSDLRITFPRFLKELLRDDRRSVSAYDSRLMTIDALGVNEYPDFDFVLNVLGAPFTMLLYDYTRRELGYETDAVYETINMEVNRAWDWGKPIDGWPDTSEALRSAMSRNTAMRVFVAAGLYDSATPYFASRYVIDHLGLDPVLRDNITSRDYESGHMIYIEQSALAKLHADITAFLGSRE